MDELNEMMGFLITSGKVDNTFALIEDNEDEEEDEEELEDNIFNFESSPKKPKTKIKK